MERGGRTVPGFALADAPSGGGTVAMASVMTGATVGLFAYVLKAPLWVSLLSGTGAALVTKYGIERSA